MAQEEIAAHEGRFALGALERSLFGICAMGNPELADCLMPRPLLLRACLEGAARTSLHLDHDLRLLSCLLRCSLRLKALEQNWHLYRRSLPDSVVEEAMFDALRAEGGDACGEGCTASIALIVWSASKGRAARACYRQSRDVDARLCMEEKRGVVVVLDMEDDRRASQRRAETAASRPGEESAMQTRAFRSWSEWMCDSRRD